MAGSFSVADLVAAVDALLDAARGWLVSQIAVALDVTGAAVAAPL